jgi:hypothetical protein
MVLKMARKKVERTSQMTIRLQPKVIEGIEQLSDRFGIASSTLAGLAIGEYVAKNLAAFDNQAAMLQTMGKEIAHTLSAPMASMFEGKTDQELLDMVKK